MLYRGDEVICEAHVGPGALAPAVAPFEIFLWQRAGTAALTVDGDAAAFAAGDCAVIPKGATYAVDLDAEALLLSVANTFT